MIALQYGILLYIKGIIANPIDVLLAVPWGFLETL